VEAGTQKALDRLNKRQTLPQIEQAVNEAKRHGIEWTHGFFYEERGIIDDERDWHKWFKCSDIDPTVLPSAMVNRARQRGYALLFANRILHRPIETWKLLHTLGRYMKVSDILTLLSSPFKSRALNRKPELPARMIDLGLTEPIPATTSI
jgi:anaerobic magnesium-protoporphyrin IX monomethyl ester cyclase